MAASPDYQIFGDKYAYLPLSPEIGKGGQAKVYKGRDLSTNTDVAIKKIQILPKSTRLLDQELSNIKKLSSPYIVKYLEDTYFELVGEDQFAILVMEYVGGGTLAAYLRAHGHVDEETAFKWIQQLVLGLSAAWDNDIVHRDIKPANILLTKPSPEGDIRICDFGISKDVRVDPAKTKIGTPKYMAPEIGAHGKEYNLSVDIYSLGLVYLDLLFGLQIAKEPLVLERLQQLQTSNFSDFAKKLIPKMVERNPNFRLQPASILPLFRYSAFEQLRSTPICSTYRVWDLSTSSAVLFKQFNEPFDMSFKIEASIVSDTAEAGVISFIQCITNSCFYERVLILENCEGGTLQHYIEQHGPVQEQLAKPWLSSLLQTLQLLHRKSIVVRSLSPSNIVLTRNSLNAELKMCDFELAAMRIARDGPYKLGTDLGVCEENLAYRAPELLRNSPVTTASDIWSLGCVFFYILTGKNRFGNSSSEPCTVNSVLQAHKQPQTASSLSEKCSELLNGMMRLNEWDRFETEACLSHSFFTFDPQQGSIDIPTSPQQRAVFQALITAIKADIESNSLNSAYIKVTVAQQLLTRLSEKPSRKSIAEALSRAQQQIAYLADTVRLAQRDSPDLTEETVKTAFKWLGDMVAAEKAEEWEGRSKAVS